MTARLKFEKLELKQFKSFEQATLALGHFTLLVGSNATGKSNLRDAFRFLHGIGRGYTLAEIIGEKRSEGERVWSGIRGGTRGLVFQNKETFTLKVVFSFVDSSGHIEYVIEVNPSTNGTLPCIVHEKLTIRESHRRSTFDVVNVSEPTQFKVRLEHSDRSETLEDQIADFANHQPILSQCIERKDISVQIKNVAELVLETLKSMRFLDPETYAMQQPSFPGQTVLSDRGENLAAILFHIAQDPIQKEKLVTWLQMLTPMDVHDLVFETDPTGRILLNLIEANGQKTPAYNASGGTLRFLAMLAALLVPEPAKIYFFEELENGIHPTRLHLLLSLMEQQTEQGATQIIASTHSPQVLLRVHQSTLECSTFTYRLEETADTRIKQLLAIPDVRNLLQTQDIARLHESGWFEDAVEFLVGEDGRFESQENDV